MATKLSGRALVLLSLGAVLLSAPAGTSSTTRSSSVAAKPRPTPPKPTKPKRRVVRKRKRPAKKRPVQEAAEVPPLQIPEMLAAPEEPPIEDVGPKLEPAPIEVRPALQSYWEWLLTSFRGSMERLQGLDTLLLLALMVVFVGLVWATNDVRTRLEVAGILPRLLGVVNLVSRLAILVCSMLLIAQRLPTWVWRGPALLLVLLGIALALGWSARDLLPDMIAGMVIAAERRYRPGMWLSGEGFHGRVERIGARATWLIDGTERRVAVPNRRLLNAPVVYEEEEAPTREVRLVLAQAIHTAEQVRAAILDAVAASPWTLIEDRPIVRQDTTDARCWSVRARLLELKHAERFEGELLERVEAHLRGSVGP